MSGLDCSTETLGAQGLNAAASLNQISDTYVGIWNLENTSSSVPVNVEFRPSQSVRGSNGIGATDGRQLVADADVAPGGKYRSIVKLFLRYASQKESDPWMIATGWLIAPDLIVTAGHSAFDWSYKMGRLAQVKAYVGYNGRASAGDPTSVQFQPGGQVATTAEWLRSKGIRAYNLAFIKVQKPFTGIVPINFQDTPRSGISSLGVVGYAGDIVDDSTGENGARMYESFSNTGWNLEDSEYTMLEYDIDSYGGNSGSPVLRKEDMVSIGTHVYGGSPSLASVIGLLGSPYDDYVAAFSVEPRRSQTQTDGIKFVHISVTGTVPQALNTQQQSQYDDAQGQKPCGNGNAEPSNNQQPSQYDDAQGLNPCGNGNADPSNNQQPNQYDFQGQDPCGNGNAEPSNNQQPSQYGVQGQDPYGNGNPEPSNNQQPNQYDVQGRDPYGIGNAEPSNNQPQNQYYAQDQKQYGNDNTEPSKYGNSVLYQNGSTPNNDLNRNLDDAEFFQILKLGIRLSDPILSNILQVHQPMVLGSVGSPVGALAGAILSAAGKLATQSSSLVHEFRQGLPYDGILERAILGEAAFCAVISMKRRKLEELGVISEMAKVVKKIAPATKEIAPFIMHTLTAPALRIALDALHNDADGLSAKSTIANGSKSSFAQQTTPSSGTLDPDSENFFKRLRASCATSGGIDGSPDGVDQILQIGFYEAGPILTTAAYEGLQTLATILPDNPSGGEGIPAHHPYIDGLPERAMLGEAALQALMKVPMQRLDKTAFDIMAQSVARIGQIVLQSAHGLIEDIGFAVKGILAIHVASANADTGGNDESTPNGFAAENDQSARSAIRRGKGFSYANLEREVLAYYRGMEAKQQSAVEF